MFVEKFDDLLSYMDTASHAAQSVKNLPAMQETRVQFLGREDPLEKEMATHSLQYSCLENLMERGAWCQSLGVNCSPWSGKELDMTEHALMPSRRNVLEPH